MWDVGGGGCAWWYAPAVISAEGGGVVAVERVKRVGFPFKLSLCPTKFVVFISGPPPDGGDEEVEDDGKEEGGYKGGKGKKRRTRAPVTAATITALLRRLLAPPDSRKKGIPPPPTRFVAIPALLTLHLHQEQDGTPPPSAPTVYGEIPLPPNLTPSTPNRLRSIHILPFGLLPPVDTPPKLTPPSRAPQQQNTITTLALQINLTQTSHAVWSQIYLPSVRRERGVFFHGRDGPFLIDPPSPKHTSSEQQGLGLGLGFLLIPGNAPLSEAEGVLERTAREGVLPGQGEPLEAGGCIFMSNFSTEMEKATPRTSSYSTQLPASWWLPGPPAPPTSPTSSTTGRIYQACTTRAMRFTSSPRTISTWEFFWQARILREAKMGRISGGSAGGGGGCCCGGCYVAAAAGMAGMRGGEPEEGEGGQAGIEKGGKGEGGKGERGQAQEGVRWPWLAGEVWVRQVQGIRGV